MAVLVILAGAAIVWPDASLWTPLLGVLISVFAGDALLARSRCAVRAQRRLPRILPVRHRHRVTVLLRNDGRDDIDVSVRDEAPADFSAPLTFTRLRLAAGGSAQWQYDVQPLRRGEVRFGCVQALIGSPLGLWQLRRRIGQGGSLRVYPDYGAIAQYLDLLADQQSRQLGLRRAQRRGEGLEFQQLRDFRDGDSIRQIDWKATARRRELISREYTEERDQSIVFMLDTGGRMRALDGGLSHFDHALNALLLLAYVALRQGDRVSLQTFGPQQRWLAELRGASAINRLLQELYDLHSQAGAGDYMAAAEALMTRQRKRALVVLISNLRQSDDDLQPAVDLLRSRHAVLVASLRERALDEALHKPVVTFDDALTVLGAHGYRQRRRALSRSLGASAQLVADCLPEELPAQLVNGYWALKRAGAL
jgi:uncharacterized protein (DUF58 family)